MVKVRGERCVLLKFGELALKGRNRPLFVNALELVPPVSSPLKRA